MARRFEPRLKHAPMDYTYDRPDTERIAPWSPFKEVLERSRAQSQLANSSSTPSAPPDTTSVPAPPHSPFQFGAPGSNRMSSSFAFTSPPTEDPFSWRPPQNFSPQKAFPTSSSSVTETPDVSMSIAGTDTPDASPTAARRVRNNGATNGSHSDPLVSRYSTSPLRRSAMRARERDRSREREREHGRRRGLMKTKETENETNGDDNQQGPLQGRQYHLHFLGPSLSHADVPYVLSSYLQLFFNLALLLAFLYGLVVAILTIHRDVEERIAEYSANTLREMAHCSKQYLDNRCDPSQRIPHMEETCRAWEECMHRDPSVVGRARIFAETAAQVVNGFVEEISWKTLGFTLISLGFVIVFTNSILNLYRARHAPGTSTSALGQSNPSLIPSLPPYQQALLPPAQVLDPWTRSVSPGFYSMPALLAAPPSPSKDRTQ